MKKKKILIIKTGYSEFLEGHRNTRKPSLGDILRTTSLLHLYKNDDVTWVTDEKGESFPLLKKNPYINRLLNFDFYTAAQLQKERFDTIINLEKTPGIGAIVENISSVRNFGFRFDPEKRTSEAYDKAHDILSISYDALLKKQNKKIAQELLFEIVGEKWNGEEYILGYKPKIIKNYDIGLNTNVGEKWPTKKWPTENWDKLENILIKNKFKVTRQDKQSENILTNLNEYMDWINSSKLIVSSDSLGMHLGIALKKQVIGLFGPTSSNEVYFYNKGRAILPNTIPKCLPCFRESCIEKKFCMDDIKPERIYKEIYSTLK